MCRELSFTVRRRDPLKAAVGLCGSHLFLRADQQINRFGSWGRLSKAGGVWADCSASSHLFILLTHPCALWRSRDQTHHGSQMGNSGLESYIERYISMDVCVFFSWDIIFFSLKLDEGDLAWSHLKQQMDSFPPRMKTGRGVDLHKLRQTSHC